MELWQEDKMSAQKTERRNYDEQFITKLATIETRQLNVIDELKQVSEHLKAINGSILDYHITKNKVENACLKMVELEAELKDKMDWGSLKKFGILITTIISVLTIPNLILNVLKYIELLGMK